MSRVVLTAPLRFTPPQPELYGVLRAVLETALPEYVPLRRDDRTVWDMLSENLTVRDARRALDGIAGGAGGELAADSRGRVALCAAESSALMAVNFLAPFGSRGGLFGQLDHGRLTFERELRVSGVRAKVGPTLDAVLETAQGTIAIEAKLAEPWRDERKWEISGQYDTPAARVSPKTRATLDAIRSEALDYRYLDVAQLVKHLLGIHSALERGPLAGPVKLVLLYWRPRHAGRFTGSFARLQDELADLAARLDDQSVILTAVSTASLLEAWAAEDQPPWLRDHADLLARRYDSPLPS